MGRSYSKGQGVKKPLTPSKVNKIIDTPQGGIDKDIASTYTKKDGVLDPSLFIIVSGGEVRERDYFSFFQNKNYSFPRVIVEFIAENKEGVGGLDVDKLIELSLEIKKDKDKSKSEDIVDSINIVTDVDHFYDQIQKNQQICLDNDITMIVSNPCFELWLYYSYYNEIPDFEIPENHLKISSNFKTYLNQKHKGGVDPRKAPLVIHEAINNSKSNYFEDEYNIPKLFSTQMHFLASKLYELTKYNIEEIIKFKEQQRKKYYKG